MMIMDKEHFYKVDGEFLVYVNDLCEAVDKKNFIELMLAGAKIFEKFKTMSISEIKAND